MNRTIFSGAALLAGFCVSSYAGAFTFTTCNGDKVVWEEPFQMVRNLPSFLPGGAHQADLDNAIGRWNGVQGMANMVSVAPFFGLGNVVTTGNDQNDVAVSPRSAIGGNNGLTLMISSWCVFSSSWQEADVFAASDLTFGHIAEDTLIGTSGRSTYMHEFGHAHGLDHHQRFNNMRTPQPRPMVGGPNETIDALPDDAAGGRFLYPNGNQEINIFASAQRLNGATDKILLNNSGTVVSCATGGGTISLSSTAGNNGTVNLVETERWWVSTSPNAHSGGIQIFQLNNNALDVNKVKTTPVTFKMPALPLGTYFLYHGVDVLHNFTESREDDNNVREALIIKVVNC